jgi:APA family basic amino acid/polyamine antiporter
MPQVKSELIRGLTLTGAASLVIGIVIGTGIYLKPATMAQQVGTPSLVLAAWIAAGILSLAGALTYAELGAMLPYAGGEYVYLRSAYGDTFAFLNGWMGFVIGGAGIAAVGAAFATFLLTILPVGRVWLERTLHLFGQEIRWQFGTGQVIGVGIILLFSALNCLGVVFGGRVQTILTAAKVLGIAAVITGVVLLSSSAAWSNLAPPPVRRDLSGLSGFGAAMLSALWAYNGWSFLTRVGGEIRDPGRNVPRALIGGMSIVLAIYCLANLAYFYALPFDEIASSNSTMYRNAPPVAAKAVQTFLGPTGLVFITVAFLISSLGTLNGTILSTARIPFAMARDGLFFSKFGDLNQHTRVPVWTMGIQAIWASLLALSGTFDQLTNLSVFAYWIFYAATATAVFVLRRRMPDAPRPYRTFGYPLVPAVFVIVAAWLVLNTLWTSPVESAAGLLFVALGLPAHLLYRRSRSALLKTAAETNR